MYVAVDEVGALDAQQRGHLALGHRFLHLRAGAAVSCDVGVIRHLPQEEVVHPLALGPHAVSRSLRRVVKQGKELGAAAELPPPLQVDMAAVLPQMTGGCIIAALFLPALAVLQGGSLTGLHAAVNGITMGVKIGYHRVNLLIEKHFC